MALNIKNIWDSLLSNYSANEKLAQIWWNELTQQYSGKNRAYHNLRHLEAMFAELEKHQAAIMDIELLQFSIFYHDIIYHAMRKDNELKSAKKAKAILKQLAVPSEKMEQCFQQIMITKKHEVSESSTNDEKYLIDFDLEVLSRDWSQYKIYSQQVRKEYWMFPDFMYKKGRKKALQSFLNRAQIYQTPAYLQNHESQARANIRKEIAELL